MNKPELIESIDDYYFDPDGGNKEDFNGYVIKTSKQTIYIGIESGQSCCENFGYITSEDDFNDYIHAELLGVKIVDDALQVIEIELKERDLYDCGQCIFVNVETSKGMLQFVLYNEHNGYYGHRVAIRSDQVVLDCVI